MNYLAKKQNGFSLIELMIVVVIIGIISSIAVPTYFQKVQTAARGEGMSELLEVMRMQENFFSNNYTYTTDLTDINLSDPYELQSERYEIEASLCANLDITQCILLTATDIKNQAGDGILSLDSQGNRIHNGNRGWSN